MEEGFYTLFVPYHTDKMIKIPDYTKYIDKYRQNLLKVGIIYSKDDLYIIKFVNDLFTNVLTTALIEKLKIISKEFDYQLISFQKNFEEINNMKYFSEILKLNKKKNRLTNIFPIKKMHNHFYLFSKI